MLLWILTIVMIIFIYEVLDNEFGIKWFTDLIKYLWNITRK